jgi:hypothetical protein
MLNYTAFRDKKGVWKTYIVKKHCEATLSRLEPRLPQFENEGYSVVLNLKIRNIQTVSGCHLTCSIHSQLFSFSCCPIWTKINFITVLINIDKSICNKIFSGDQPRGYRTTVQRFRVLLSRQGIGLPGFQYKIRDKRHDPVVMGFRSTTHLRAHKKML